MTFGEAWAGIEIGAGLSVSNGRPAPPEGSLRHAAWRSNNFSGPLVAKIEGSPRKLRIQALSEAGRTIAYDVAEGGGHTFELAE